MSAAFRYQRPDYQPGDLVVFAGRSLISRLIAIRTCPPICWFRGWMDSHIGIVGVYRGQTYLFESTTLSDLPCSITGKDIRGVKAVDPQARVETYDGKCWRLPVRRGLSESKSEALSDALIHAIGTPYEDLASMGLVGTRFLKRHWLFREDVSRLFCSELVVYCLERIGLFPPANASIWTPSGTARRVVWQGTHSPRVRVNSDGPRAVDTLSLCGLIALVALMFAGCDVRPDQNVPARHVPNSEFRIPNSPPPACPPGST